MHNRQGSNILDFRCKSEALSTVLRTIVRKFLTKYSHKVQIRDKIAYKLFFTGANYIIIKYLFQSSKIMEIKIDQNYFLPLANPFCRHGIT